MVILSNFNKSNIHILNAIGLAFDNQDQPDYQFYKKILQDSGLEAANNLVESFYIKLFELIFKSALSIRNKKPTIVMSLVGANNFAKLWLYPTQDGISELAYINSYSGIIALQTIWATAFNKVYPSYRERLSILFMGADRTLVLNKIQEVFSEIRDIGVFPNNLQELEIKDNLDNTFFVNAWDCWSLPGNGNKADGSLDGRIGSRTNIAFAGTTLTNPFMEFIQLES